MTDGQSTTVKRRGIFVTALVVVAMAAGLFWLLRSEAPAEQRQLEPRPTNGKTAPGSAIAQPKGGSALAAAKASAPASGEGAGGFGGKEEAPPNLLAQIAALHGMVTSADIAAYLQKNADLAAKHVDDFCKQAKQLPQRAPFGDSRRLRDASSYLVNRVDWEGSPEGPPRSGALHLPQPLVDKLGAAGDAWPQAITDADLQGLDFSWLRELQGYDTWDLAAVGPLKDFTGNDLFAAPLPLYSFSTRWMKLRFAQALRTGDLLEASAEAHHLADLLHAQGMLIADMYAVALLRIDRTAWEAASAQGLNVAGWTPTSTDDLDSFSKLTRASPNFFFPGVAPDVMARALECAPAPCSALTEASWMQVAVGEFAPTDNSKDFWPMAEKQSCEAGVRKKIRSGTSIKPTEAQSALASYPQTLEKYFGTPPAK
jgi:hypothetical protein